MARLAVALVLAASLCSSGCIPVLVGGAAAGGAVVAADRRPGDVQLSDERIEHDVSNGIDKAIKDNGSVGVTAFNRQVLLTGEVTTEELKQKAEQIAAGESDVKAVFNELEVIPPTSFTSKSNDAYLTSAVKARFVSEGKFNALHVRVVTEDGVVYLMGVVTHSEADDATQIARYTSGVKRVVRLFEYMVEPAPKAAAPATPAAPAAPAAAETPAPPAGSAAPK